MFSRRALSTAACALACAAATPAAASAAQIDVKPLHSTPDQLVQRNGAVYAVQPSDQYVTSFGMADGAQRSDVRVGGAASPQGAALGPRGVYLGIPDDASTGFDDRGYTILDDSPQPSSISLASSIDCGPKVLAWAADIDRMLFFTCTHGGARTGGGMSDGDGGHVTLADPGGEADKLFYAQGGHLWATFGSHLRRYAVTATSWTLESDEQVQGAISGMALGPDGKLWMTNDFTGEVTERPLDGSGAPTTVVSGLQRPTAIATDPWTPAYISVNGHGSAAWVSTDAGLVRIDPVTHRTTTVALPGGFRPDRIEIKDNDVWTTDGSGAARIARVVADPPYAGEVHIDGLTVSATFTPNGEDTHAQLLLMGPYPTAPLALQAIDLGTVPGAGGPKTLSFSAAGLAPGTYSVVAHASNVFGDDEGVVHPSFTVPAPQPAPLPPARPTPKPAAAVEKPRLADLVSLASAKRCVATRSLRLTLHKRAKGAATVTRLTVTIGHGKTKAYTSAKLKHGLKLIALPKSGRYALKLVVTLSDKTTVKQTLSYTACKPKRH